MKLSKYIHSCVLLEESGELLLVDPGTFTFKLGVKPEQFAGVRTIILTHNHPDHIDMDALQTICASNTVTVVTNEEIKQKLEEAGIQAKIHTDATYKTERFSIEAIPADHEAILADSLPKNFGYRVNGTLLITGDSFAQSLKDISGIDVLMLPISAPWNTELEVFDFGCTVKPKRIVPVHDGYLQDFFITARHENYQKQFHKKGIEFISLVKPGDSVEL